MSSLPFYVVHAFTSERFAGNPAAVVFDDLFPDVDVMQQIAAENRLSETAFLQPHRENDDWDLRWFTPEVEVDLCGHATLAAAYTIFQDVDPDVDRVTFHTASGALGAEWLGDADGVLIDLPLVDVREARATPQLLTSLGLSAAPKDVRATPAGRWLVHLADEATVRGLTPDMAALGVIVTAPGDDADIASRFFAPAIGVPEDPVTGSAHAALVPYWCSRLGEKEITCDQVGPRGGTLVGSQKGKRVLLSGTAVLYVRGELVLQDEE